jgi:hypothetical protein
MDLINLDPAPQQSSSQARSLFDSLCQLQLVLKNEDYSRVAFGQKVQH